MASSDPPNPLDNKDKKALVLPRKDKENDEKEKEARKSQSAEAKQEEKRRRREEKLRRDAHRPLDSWERYRALMDAVKEAQDLVDLADHKARFALIIMGALNAVLFVLATRSEVFDQIPAIFRPWMAIYLGVFALVGLYFVVQAIESLRPRRARPRVRYQEGGGYEEYPLGLRFYEDILQRDVEAYRAAWREVHLGQLNAELALQAHGLAKINHAKYTALRRLYLGLQIMTLMVAGLLLLAGSIVFLSRLKEQSSASEARPLKSGKPKRGGLDLLGEPVRLAGAGAKEPSGVAYHPRLGRLFVVGDEGRLVELDPAGAVLASHKVKGNLEDVAVHAPTGNLILLSEKRSDLVWYDPALHQERRRWRLDVPRVLGREPVDRNQGFEGLAYRDAGAQGGLLYLVHQRRPAMIVVLTFDPERSAELLGSEAVVDRWPLDDDDLRAAAYVPSLDRLLVISDTKDRLLVLRMDGSKEAEVVLPGLQQEGLCLDGRGDLWVADDRGGLLRFPGALSVLESHLVKETSS